MGERVTKRQPVSDIDFPFGSISYSFQHDAVLVRMIGAKIVVLHFSGVVALRFEQECPGFEFPALSLPILRPAQTFPLLLVEGSEWLEQFSKMYKDISHW